MRFRAAAFWVFCIREQMKRRAAKASKLQIATHKYASRGQFGKESAVLQEA